MVTLNFLYIVIVTGVTLIKLFNLFLHYASFVIVHVNVLGIVFVPRDI